MRTKQVVACLVSALLVFPASVTSSPAPVVGLTVSANYALLGNAGLHAGATIFSGDPLRAGRGGSAVVSASGGTTLAFGEGTAATLGRAGDAGLVRVDLQSGSLSFHVTGENALEVRLADAVIRSAGVPAKALVTLVTPRLAMVGAEAGEITVSTPRDGRSVTLRAGDTAEVALPDKTAANPQTQQPAAKSASGEKTAMIGVVVIGGITSLLLIASAGLSRSEQQALVSPFRLR